MSSAWISRSVPWCWRVLGGLLMCMVPALTATAQQGRLHVPAAVAQMRRAVAPSRALPIRQPAAAHYDVVALRVEFQPDTTRFTAGDGTFAGDLFGSLSPSVDPLPHDAAYFEAHLEFLRNYVDRVSDGRTQLTTHLVPEVIRVSQPMAAYSPTGPNPDRDAELAKLGALVQEAWALASEQSSFDLSGFDPAHTAFILFHAGVGRDLELVGTTLDKTPEDLPSLFFDSAALQRLTSHSSFTFNGFPVDHTMILPRTETRRGMDFIQDQPFLLELSTNGLVAASFFNYLGVPDLFDTSNGESAIGPFGLMDPLGFFAYFGLFPPEPSGWTKQFLGWTQPETLTGAGPLTAGLDAASIPGSSDLVRAAMSPAEYFLVENRNRDPQGDGATLRVWKDGQIQEQHFENGDETFNDATIEGFMGGVVVDVDDFDWALPGGLDEHGNALVGGILIWHVDERQLAAGLGANAVNADPERRALDLEEADGAQDLGFPRPSATGGTLPQASPFDFFYQGNPVSVRTQFGGTFQLYENRFGPDTVPNSDNNDGGPSFITLEDFSPPLPHMTFSFHRAAAEGVVPDTVLTGLSSDASFLDGSFVGANADGSRLLLVSASTSTQGARVVVVDASTGAPERQVEAGAFLQPVTIGTKTYALGLSEEGIVVADLSPEGETFHVPDAAEALVGSVVGMKVDGADRLYAIAREGDTNRLLVVEPSAGGGAVSSLQASVVGLGALATDGETLIQGGTSEVRVGDDVRWRYDTPAGHAIGQAAFGDDATGLVGVVPVPEDGTLRFLLADGSTVPIDVAERAQHLGLSSHGTLNGEPILADLDGDDRLDVLTTYGDALLAFGQGGALVPGFPIGLAAPVDGQPLVARLTDSGGPSVVVGTRDGSVYAYDVGRRSEIVAGFPLSVGLQVPATPLIASDRLVAVAEDGHVQAWVLENLGAVSWGRKYAMAHNGSFVSLDVGPGLQPAAAPLLVDSETYNWPNPIEDGATFIRCMTTRDARVEVKIIDAAGTLVDTIRMEGLRAGTAVEQRWETQAQSGLYYARVTAIASDGARDTKLVKMAIIR